MCARPVKCGIEYFPLDVDMDSDTAVCVLEARHGIEGFGVLIKLFMRVYRSGYFIPWDEREGVVFARRSGVAPETLDAIVDTALEEGLFHRGMFDSHGILTSGGIQKRFTLAAKRRIGSGIKPAYELAHTETDDAATVKEAGEEKSARTVPPAREVVFADDEPPAKPKTSFPACLSDTTTKWSRPDLMGDDKMYTSQGAIMTCMERKLQGIVSPKLIGEMGTAIKAQCYKGCDGRHRNDCGELICEKIKKARTMNTAIKFVHDDERV